VAIIAADAVVGTMKNSRAHVWRFFRAGGFDQVNLSSGDDVAALGALDQKLWVALACPTRGIEFDERTLDLIDSDQDGRIRAPEILDAAHWATGLLKNLDGLTDGRDVLPLAALNGDSEEGRELHASATAILRMLGKAQAVEISLQDAADSERIFNATPFNGDGIIPPEAAEDAETHAAIEQIIVAGGGDNDRSGKPGLSELKAAEFFAGAADYSAWCGEAETAPNSILPLGPATEAAAGLLRELRPKLDDYFTRNRLAAFDRIAGEALNPPRALYEALAAQNVTPDQPEIRALPLAHIDAGLALPLDQNLNPAFVDQIGRFRREIVTPLIGDQASLSERDWAAIKERFAPYEAWSQRRPTAAAASLDVERVRRLLQLKPRIDDLIARDKALEREMSAITRVEKLLRFQRDLLPLLNNMISFRDFYTRTGKAAFQAGTLYIDGRSCDLCVAVADEAKHAQLATLSRIYLAYCSCSRRGGTEKMTIAAAVTAGDADNLLVGRNGLFYDRKGRDWDATIIKIIEHPISIRQAFWLPYRQAARFVTGQVQKFAAARAAANQTQMATATLEPQPAAAAAPTPAPATAGTAAAAPAKDQTYDAARFAGIFAAIGLAIGAIGTAIASTVTGFLNLSWWQMPLAVVGLILLISGPSVLIAALKLRSRNLGPILDACGWAVNTRLRINIPFGTALTSLARLPEHAVRSLSDPYADKRRPWPLYAGIAIVLVALAAAWRLGLFNRWLDR
jgi:hypothetical protein